MNGITYSHVSRHAWPITGSCLPLGLLEPHPQHLALAVHRDRERQVAGLALHRAAIADLQHQGVEERHRVDVIQRPPKGSTPAAIRLETLARSRSWFFSVIVEGMRLQFAHAYTVPRTLPSPTSPTRPA